MRIVIIDDQRLNIAILEASLRGEAGLEIVSFERGAEAVEWIRAERPDLVFVDYDMPEMDGLQVVGALREDPSLEDMPVVMVSGVEEKEVRLKALTLGANDFLAKPVDPIELRARTANMLRLRRRSLDLRETNRSLEEARARAEAALADLRSAQDQLVQTEKLAALGSLVAGVAHEINTPIGNALTSITWTADRAARMKEDLAAGQLRRTELADFLEEAGEVTQLVRANVERTARIVQAFKQIAADSTTDEPRRLMLRDHLEDLHIAFASELAKGGHRLVLQCREELELITPPGALTRVLAQLVQNAIAHAYPHRRSGVITISARPYPVGMVRIEVADDGRGISGEVQSRLFEPFFTTARGQGHIGLGLATVHNLVRRALAGEIELDTCPGTGTRFRITVPAVPPSPVA
ncbi:sensor histidine kinase [Indioceanicola profundi]|uniref:sensor histidine kinase n=1 Tax=Indioceanicola profundi TaxID=2220096 RepID=UPI000E6AB55C|nr:response regulator [Indioceanicola profundi]